MADAMIISQTSSTSVDADVEISRSVTADDVRPVPSLSRSVDRGRSGRAPPDVASSRSHAAPPVRAVPSVLPSAPPMYTPWPYIGAAPPGGIGYVVPSRGPKQIESSSAGTSSPSVPSAGGLKDKLRILADVPPFFVPGSAPRSPASVAATGATVNPLSAAMSPVEHMRAVVVPLLNKVTARTLDEVCAQLLQIDIADPQMLQAFVGLIIDKVSLFRVVRACSDRSTRPAGGCSLEVLPSLRRYLSPTFDTDQGPSLDHIATQIRIPTRVCRRKAFSMRSHVSFLLLLL